MRFRFTETAIDTGAARAELVDGGAGGYVSFEGWVRDHNEGRAVTRLEYEAFQALAVTEGDRIVAEAVARFPIKHALCLHRLGSLELTDMAVWVGVSAVHRGEAFDACRYIIDEVKHRVPIWKKEHYRSGDSGWVNCEACAAAPRRSSEAGHGSVHRHVHDRGHDHDHDHDHGHGHGEDHARVRGDDDTPDLERTVARAPR